MSAQTSSKDRKFTTGRNNDPTLAALIQLVSWCQEHALPYWAERGMDPNGGCYESLAHDGTPNQNALRRVRVQARMAYSYAHAAHLGWYDDARSVSDHCWAYLVSRGFAGGPHGCAHLLNPDGSVHDDMRDTYAQAFVILAGAWRYRAFNDEAALETALDTVAFLDETLSAENGGWLEGLPSRMPRRQNPHMHLFEAFISLFDATQDQAHLDRAGEILTLFNQHFWEPKDNTIIEFFDADWSRVNGHGGPVEPGHMMEWAWLLSEYSARSGHSLHDKAKKLYDTAIDQGQNPKTGLLLDTVDAQTSRSWGATEYLKAAIALARTGDEQAHRDIVPIIQSLFDHYFTNVPDGGYADQVDMDGMVISDSMSASTFYHYMCTCAEAADYLNTIQP